MEDYDSVPGIRNALTSLASFQALVRARQEAVAVRHERLHSFCVLGRFWLEVHGEFCKLRSGPNSVIPKELFPDFPDVIAGKVFWDYLAMLSCEDLPVCYDPVPMVGSEMPCSVCGRVWTLSDLHDQVSDYRFQVMELTEFVGQTLGAFKAHLLAQKDALYLVKLDKAIRNDRYIDLRPNPRFPVIISNQYGWVGWGSEITDDYIIQAGDQTYLDVWHVYHPACRDSQLRIQRQTTIGIVMEAAGYERFEWDSFNDYDADVPSLTVQTEVGEIVFIWHSWWATEINWSASDQNLLHLFGDVIHTKNEYLVYAKENSEAIDYLHRIREALSKSPAEVG